MSPAETTQLIHTLQGVLSAAKAIAAGVPRAWYEVWLPPTVTVLGWIVLILINQKNNRDLVQLQKKDLATNRILDALDSYMEYLDDVEFPGNLLWRDGVLSDQQPTVQGRDEQGLKVFVPNPDAVSLAIASLSFSDLRRRRWIDILHREAWTYDKRQGIVVQVAALQKYHEIIMADLKEFEAKQIGPDTQESSSQPATVILGRDGGSLWHIKQQQDAVSKLYTDLSSSDFPGSHRHTKKDSDTAAETVALTNPGKGSRTP